MNSHHISFPPLTLPPHLLLSHTAFSAVLVQWGQARIQSRKLRWGKESFVGGEVGAERLVLLIFNPNNFSGAVH